MIRKLLHFFFCGFLKRKLDRLKAQKTAYEVYMITWWRWANLHDVQSKKGWPGEQC